MKFTNHLLQLVRKLFFMVSVYSIWHWESVTKTCNCMTARGVDCTRISVYCRELVPWCRGKCLFPVSRSRFVHDLVFPILTKFPSMKRRTNLIHPPFSSQIKMFFCNSCVHFFWCKADNCKHIICGNVIFLLPLVVVSLCQSKYIWH